MGDAGCWLPGEGGQTRTCSPLRAGKRQSCSLRPPSKMPPRGHDSEDSVTTATRNQKGLSTELLSKHVPNPPSSLESRGAGAEQHRSRPGYNPMTPAKPLRSVTSPHLVPGGEEMYVEPSAAQYKLRGSAWQHQCGAIPCPGPGTEQAQGETHFCRQAAQAQCTSKSIWSPWISGLSLVTYPSPIEVPLNDRLLYSKRLLLHALVSPQSSFHATLIKRSPTY